MPLVMTHRPSKPPRQRTEVLKEVKAALEKLGKDTEAVLDKDVKDWNDKPKFKSTITVTSKLWRMDIKEIGSTKAKKHYAWVDKGTSVRGGFSAQPYIIVPKKYNVGGRLVFMVPHSPKTLPNPPISGFPPTGPKRLRRVKIVHHPGIYPRNFTATVLAALKSKKSGSFKNVVEAAVKRGLRKAKAKGQS